MVRRRVGHDRVEIADALALGRGKGLGRIVLFAERADGREFRSDVEDAVAAHGDHGGAIDLRQPDAASQRSPRAVLWEKILGCQCRHGRVLAVS